MNDLSKSSETFYAAAWLPRAEPLSPEEERLAAAQVDASRLQYWETALVGPDAMVAGVILRRELELDRHPQELRADIGARIAVVCDGERGPTVTAHDLAASLAFIDPECEIANRVLADLKAFGSPSHAAALGQAQANLHAAVERFAIANVRLVLRIARGLAYLELSLDDRVQEGTLGLRRAVLRYDLSRGVPFAKFAGGWIRHAIVHASHHAGTRAVRVPTHIHERAARIRRTRARLTTELHRIPTPEEVAVACSMSVQAVERCELAQRAPLSLDAPVHGGPEPDSRTIGQTIAARSPDMDKLIDLAEAGSALHIAVSNLPERMRKIVEMRFGFAGRNPMTFEAVGAELGGLTRQRVEQIQSAALVKLRRMLQRHDSDRKSAARDASKKSVAVRR